MKLTILAMFLILPFSLYAQEKELNLAKDIKLKSTKLEEINSKIIEKQSDMPIDILEAGVWSFMTTKASSAIQRNNDVLKKLENRHGSMTTSLKKSLITNKAWLWVLNVSSAINAGWNIGQAGSGYDDLLELKAQKNTAFYDYERSVDAFDKHLKKLKSEKTKAKALGH